MKLWSIHHGASSSAELRKAGGEYGILAITLGNTEYNISLNQKEMKELFNALGKEIGYWDEPIIDRNEVVISYEKMPIKVEEKK